tara:strand:- start:578 stop:1354 length:777 start_codon:yes stop_codon:yes gene_type:complete
MDGMTETGTSTQSVFVTGGTGGLGRAICTGMAQRGHPVFFTYRSNADAAQALAAELGGPEMAQYAQADTTDAGSITAAVAAATAWRGAPHSAIFASGAHIAQPFVSQITETDWQSVLDIELMGLTRFVSAILPGFRAAGRGNFVCITSIATVSYPPGDALSAVPKAGMEMLARAIAREEGRYGIRANCVAPGLMDSGLGAEFIRELYTPDIWETQRKRIALRRFGSAEELADVVAFLAGDESRYVTGQTIYADGGFRL